MGGDQKTAAHNTLLPPKTVANVFILGWNNSIWEAVAVSLAAAAELEG